MQNVESAFAQTPVPEPPQIPNPDDGDDGPISPGESGGPED